MSASTHSQALSALLFLYRQVLGRELEPTWIVRPTQPVRLPIVLSREEVRELLRALTGTPRLVALLLYGSGLRLLEALQLRVKDLCFADAEIVIRRGKGEQDRITMMAASAHRELKTNLERVRRRHQADLAQGGGVCPSSRSVSSEVS